MSTEPDNLDPVLSLLRAKQTPRPPKRFFEQMSNRIMEGIQQPPAPAARTWWERFAADMDLKACVAGIAVCSLMLLGILYAMRLDNAAPPGTPPFAVEDAPNRIRPSTLVAVPLLRRPPEPDPQATVPSTAPVVDAAPTNSPFAIPLLPPTVPVNYWKD